MKPHWPLRVAALWWGSLGTIGFLVVPMLFANLPTPAMAGNMAARLFTAQTWLSLACGMLLLLMLKPKEPLVPAPWAQGAIVFVVLGMLAAALVEFGAAPRIVARENLRLWHTVGSVLYVVQWLCATRVLWTLSRAGVNPAGSA